MALNFGLAMRLRAVDCMFASAVYLIVFGAAAAQDSRRSEIMYPSKQWEHADPSSANWSADLLRQAQTYSEQAGSSAVMIVHRGRVVAEWGDTSRPLDVASIRKSLLSALLGIAIEDRRVELQDTLGLLGIDDREPTLSDAEKKATLADLLTSRSGVYHAIDLEPPAVAAQRPPRGSHPPGTFWYYNNWDFNAAGSIYEKAVALDVFTSFKQKIADPTGMQDFSLDACYYGESKVSIHRHYGFRLSARDLARFGLLYSRGGTWNDQQIVPARWVRTSVTPLAQPHNEIFAGRGYGYMWWSGFASDWAPTVTLPEGTFYALGFGSQYLFIIPALDLVVVHTVDLERERWPWISDFQIGRLMWLILSAANVRDVGPDTSSATAALASGEVLRTSLSGKTLRYAENAPDGPYLMRLSTDGVASLQKGPDRKQAYSGKWWLDGAKLCRGWDKFHPHFDCWPVSVEGEKISLYGDHDTMFLQGTLVTE
jgi:CubicO group peptidase (beta-lactamase class C family)